MKLRIQAGTKCMSAQRRVKQGDCIDSIAYESGLLLDTIWNHSANAELKRKRKDPNILLCGDVVVIPDKRLKQETGATEQTHRFRRKGVPARLDLRLILNDEPRRNVRYELDIEGRMTHGTTDGDGYVRCTILPNAKRGRLFLFEGDETEEIELDLGHLDPATEVCGIQERLANLGFDCEATGVMDERTQFAIAEFQRKSGLKETGQVDERTRNKLEKAHDKEVGLAPEHRQEDDQDVPIVLPEDDQTREANDHQGGCDWLSDEAADETDEQPQAHRAAREASGDESTDMGL